MGRSYERLPSSSPAPIVLDNLQCTGTEISLINCTHNGIGVHNCGHIEDAGVQCGKSPILNNVIIDVIVKVLN